MTVTIFHEATDEYDCDHIHSKKCEGQVASERNLVLNISNHKRSNFHIANAVK